MNDIGIERLFSYRILVEYCQYFNRLYEIIFESYEGTLKRKKRIALVAHDERKKDLLECVKYNKKTGNTRIVGHGNNRRSYIGKLFTRNF